MPLDALVPHGSKFIEFTRNAHSGLDCPMAVGFAKGPPIQSSNMFSSQTAIR